MSGWFAVKRGSLFEHELFQEDQPFSRREAWLWIVENAAYKPTRIDLAGTPFDVPRGCLCFSLRFMAKKFGWTVKRLRTFIGKLEAHGAISVSLEKVGQKKGTGRTLITLCNYEKYQGAGHSKGTARAQQGHKEEQGNNIPVGTPENSGIADPKKIAFDSGVKLLGASGINERQARGVVGKWVKENGPSKVIDALGKAQREGAIDPLSFCQGIFKFEKSKTTTDATNGGAFGKIPERC